MGLQTIYMGNAKRVLRYATKLNDYLAILIGLGVTIVVQSSSVTTSALTPLCGVGVLPIEKMLPMTLGADIGTTCTALIASLVSLKFGAVQIAMVHLWFNIVGIIGLILSLLLLSVGMICLGVSELFRSSVGGG